jgi:2-hydroxychromene-2-carboxylate isomerase
VTEQPVFYYDLGSPYAYLTAERVHKVLPVVPVWQPILLGGIWQETGGRSWAVTDEREAGMAGIERHAAEYDLMPIRWPDEWPTNTLQAMRAATFAASIGRAVAFSLAAFRQAFAGGHALDETHVLLAASACEMHPRAVLKALESGRVRAQLDEFTEQAAAS